MERSRVRCESPPLAPGSRTAKRRCGVLEAGRGTWWVGAGGRGKPPAGGVLLPFPSFILRVID